MHLVEVLMAATLLATALASLPTAFTGAVRANLAAAGTTWAVVLATQKIEDLRSRPFPEPGVHEAFDVLDRGGRIVDPLAGAGAYVRTWRTEPLPASPMDTIVVTVVVSPQVSGDKPAPGATPIGSVRLVTLRTRKAP
jgi:hypothetical protein